MSSDQPLLCSFESRRATEMQSLIERNGARAFVAPSMQEVPIDQNRVAVDAIRTIIDGKVDYLILLTGVGTEAMLNVADSVGLQQDLLGRMAEIPLLVRGPKPAAVLSKLNLKYRLKAPSPNTWRELMTEIQSEEIDLADTRIGVQEYGVANEELNDALADAGAEVLSIPVYKWAMPDDLGPLRHAIAQTVEGTFAALMFTSAQQVRHVIEVAESLGQREAWVQAANRMTIASIGPTCSETIRHEGLNVSLEASPPKMGPLVRATVEAVAGSES